MTILQLCLFAVCGLFATIFLRQWKPEFAPLIRLGMAIFFGMFVLCTLSPFVTYLKDLTASAGLPKHTDLLFKALGIAILCEGCAILCKESGETGIGNGVEMVGKAELLLLALPLAEELLKTAKELLSLSS